MMPPHPHSHSQTIWLRWMLLLAWTIAGLGLPALARPAAAWQQASNTPSPTHTVSPTGSASPSVTITGSLTPSGTITLTGSITPSGTITPSISPSGTITATLHTDTPLPTSAATQTPAPTSTPPLLSTFTPFPTLALISTPTLQPSAVPQATIPAVASTSGAPTATLIPFPEVTYQYPGRTPTYTLLARQETSPAGDLPKGGSPARAALRAIGRAAPLLLIGGLWLGLVIWFLVAQWLIRKK